MKLNIKFKLNRTLDKKLANSFLFQKGGGIDFGKRIVKDHPKLAPVRGVEVAKKRKKLISDYVDNFYKYHLHQLESAAQRFNKSWRKREKEFFHSVNKIFKGHSWPRGKYIGYLSIFNCNPRNLKDKTFQIYYKHPAGVVYVTSHELLHFIFYDYFWRKFKKDSKKISEEKLWEISEVVNSVLFSAAPLSEFAPKHKEKFDYPKLKSQVEQATEFWGTSRDIDKLIYFLLKT